jgi:GxxExxY protein
MPSHGDYDPEKFRHRELTEQIIGVFYDVYNELGFGFLENVYHGAMVIALQDAGLRVDSQVSLPVYFRGRVVGDFLSDIFVEQKVALELKAVEHLLTAHESQLLNYLKASAVEVGLLLNFGPKPAIKRLAFTNERKRSRPPIERDDSDPVYWVQRGQYSLSGWAIDCRFRPSSSGRER